MAGNWTYDPAQLAGTSATARRNQVRRFAGDVLVGDQQIFDEEIDLAIANNPCGTAPPFRAAAEVCRYISSQYARKADVTEQDRRVVFSALSRNYQMRADDFDRIAKIRGGANAYAGGISIADKYSREVDGDRVQPQFNLGMQDNYVPVAPVGNEVGTPQSSTGTSSWWTF